MARQSLTIEKRDAEGKSPVARRLRKTGRVPGVMYHSDGNVPFSADELELAAVLRKGATLVDVSVDGADHLTVIKDYQLHPVRGNLQHIDLQAVSMDQKVRTVVQLVLEGAAPGVKEGGIITQGTREVHVECTASSIPETIVYDVSDVHVGETITLRDLPSADGVTYLDDGGQMVVAITVPRGSKARSRADIAASEAGEATDGDAAEAPADA